MQPVVPATPRLVQAYGLDARGGSLQHLHVRPAIILLILARTRRVLLTELASLFKPLRHERRHLRPNGSFQRLNHPGTEQIRTKEDLCHFRWINEEPSTELGPLNEAASHVCAPAEFQTHVGHLVDRAQNHHTDGRIHTAQLGALGDVRNLLPVKPLAFGPIFDLS